MALRHLAFASLELVPGLSQLALSAVVLSVRNVLAMANVVFPRVNTESTGKRR